MYLNPFSPHLLRKDVEIVLSHIIRNEQKCDKTFKEYFIPVGYKGRSGLNPNMTRQKENGVEMQGFQLMKYHYETISYAKNLSQKKKPIYLQDTATSLDF